MQTLIIPTAAIMKTNNQEAKCNLRKAVSRSMFLDVIKTLTEPNLEEIPLVCCSCN